jgi:hypothetical protein
LQLPASAFSYVLQDWDQALAVEQPFGQVNQVCHGVRSVWAAVVEGVAGAFRHGC